MARGRRQNTSSVRNCSFQHTLAHKIDERRDSFVFSKENAHGLRQSWDYKHQDRKTWTGAMPLSPSLIGTVLSWSVCSNQACCKPMIMEQRKGRKGKKPLYAIARSHCTPATLPKAKPNQAAIHNWSKFTHPSHSYKFINQDLKSQECLKNFAQYVKEYSRHHSFSL